MTLTNLTRPQVQPNQLISHPPIHAIQIRAAELWLKLGEADEALRELERLNSDTWNDPAAKKLRIVAIGML